MAKLDDERASRSPAMPLISRLTRSMKINPTGESVPEKEKAMEKHQKILTFTCDVEGSTSAVVVTLSNFHTIHWAEDLRTTLQQSDFDQRSKDDGRPACDPTERETLPAGSCNLYDYPNITFDHPDVSIKKQKEKIGGKTPGQLLEVQHALLDKLLLELFKQPGFAEATDAARQTPLHALLMKDHPAAISLSRTIFRQDPKIILATRHDPEKPTYMNWMHIFIVDKHEEAVLEMIDLVCRGYRDGHLRKEHLEDIFCGQEEGRFWEELPMRHYGGTVLGFATASSMARVVYAMLKEATPGKPLEGIVALNKNACKLTGFLPVHVAIVNGRTAMYEFFSYLPNVDLMYETWKMRHSRALEQASKAGVALPTFRPSGAEFRQAAKLYELNAEVQKLRVEEDTIHTLKSDFYGRRFKGLSPLQLCAKLGDKRMLQYCLRCKAEQYVKWGPVTFYRIDLDGVDSQGKSGSDVMEIIGMADATLATQEMLLPEFMHGFMYQLFVQKWNNFVRYVFYFNRLIDFCYIGALMLLIFWIKFAEERGAPVRTTSVALVAMLVSFSWDLRGNLLGYYNNNHLDDGRVVIARTAIRRHLTWSYQVGFFNKVVGFAFTLASCIYIFAQRDVDVVTHFDSVWWLLALAVFTAFNSLRNVLFTPYEKLGVFVIVMQRTYPQIYPFLSLLFSVMFSYIVVLYTALPFRFGYDEPPSQVDNLHNPGKMMYDLIMVGLIGEPLDFKFFEDVNGTSYFNWPTSAGGFAGTLEDAYVDAPIDQFKIANLAVFLFIYMLYVLTVLILMMNLLIALMGSTHTETEANSMREHRVNFARLVLKLELEADSVAKFFKLNVHAGRPSPKEKFKFFHYFRSVDSNDEDQDTSLRERPLFDSKVEKLFCGDTDGNAGREVTPHTPGLRSPGPSLSLPRPRLPAPAHPAPWPMSDMHMPLLSEFNVDMLEYLPIRKPPSSAAKVVGVTTVPGSPSSRIMLQLCDDHRVDAQEILFTLSPPPGSAPLGDPSANVRWSLDLSVTPGSALFNVLAALDKRNLAEGAKNSEQWFGKKMMEDVRDYYTPLLRERDGTYSVKVMVNVGPDRPTAIWTGSIDGDELTYARADRAALMRHSKAIVQVETHGVWVMRQTFGMSLSAHSIMVIPARGLASAGVNGFRLPGVIRKREREPEAAPVHVGPGDEDWGDAF